MKNTKEDKSDWAIGGALLMGIGVGFIFVRESPFLFVASLLTGLGLGLVITSIISKCGRQE